MLLFGHSGPRENGSERFMWYRLWPPDRPSRRSRVGRRSHVASVSSSGGCCGGTGLKVIPTNVKILSSEHTNDITLDDSENKIYFGFNHLRFTSFAYLKERSIGT